MSLSNNFPSIRPSLLLDFANTDVIGTIYRPTEAVDEEGNPVMEELTGYHVNIRAIGEDTTAIAPFAVVPANPVRIWAS